MGVSGHHVPVWYDESVGPANGQGVFWNATTGRFEPADVDTSALDTAGLATDAELAAGLATKQPVDSDLTAIAALSTTSFGRGLLALADGAALAESIPSGTYVQKFDVTKYGATGIGNPTVDAAGIVAADAAARVAGGTVWFPAGRTFTVDSGALNITSGTKWEGEPGSVLKLKDAATTNSKIVKVVDGSTGVRITGLIIDGNRANQSTSNNRGIEIGPGCTNIEIDHNTFRDIRGSAVKGKTNATGDPCSNVRVHHNVATNCGIDDHAVFTYGYECERSSISHNVILSGGANATAIGVYNASNSCTVEGNVIDQPTLMGVEVYNSDDALVTGNTITRSGATGISVAFSDRSPVPANKLYDISLTVAINAGQGIELAGARHCLVSGNHVEYIHGSASLSVGIVNWASDAPSVRSPVNNTITGNHVKDCEASGIYSANTALRTAITANTVIDCLHGVQTSGGVYTHIVGNQVYSASATTGVYLDLEIQPLIAANSLHTTGGANLFYATPSTGARILGNHGVTESLGDNGYPGVLAPSSTGWVAGTFTAAANQGRVARFVPSRNMVIALIAFNVTTASGSDDACDVGIYTAAGVKIATSGSTTGKLNSLGVKTIAVAATLIAGTVYYASISFGTPGGTAAQLESASFLSASAARLFGTTTGFFEVDVLSAIFPLPTSLTLTGATSVGALLAVRES